MVRVVHKLSQHVEEKGLSFVKQVLVIKVQLGQQTEVLAINAFLARIHLKYRYLITPVYLISWWVIHLAAF